ncbi:MAG: NADH-quinone oxidoreductase subunit C [bacterium]
MLPEELAGRIREECGDVLLLDPARAWAILTDSGRLLEVCRNLKNIGFIRALNMTANHLGGRDFHLYLTLRHGERHDASLTLKWKFTLLDEAAEPEPGEESAPAYAGQSVHPSLSLIWRAVELMEREIFEFFGIPFAGNQNLVGLILDPQLQGFPLRRDFRAASHENYAEKLLEERADRAVRGVMHDPQF